MHRDDLRAIFEAGIEDIVGPDWHVAIRDHLHPQHERARVFAVTTVARCVAEEVERTGAETVPDLAERTRAAAERLLADPELAELVYADAMLRLDTLNRKN